LGDITNSFSGSSISSLNTTYSYPNNPFSTPANYNILSALPSTESFGHFFSPMHPQLESSTTPAYHANVALASNLNNSESLIRRTPFKLSTPHVNAAPKAWIIQGPLVHDELEDGLDSWYLADSPSWRKRARISASPMHTPVAVGTSKKRARDETLSPVKKRLRRSVSDSAIPALGTQARGKSIGTQREVKPMLLEELGDGPHWEGLPPKFKRKMVRIDADESVF
jgi:hypothetical protein